MAELHAVREALNELPFHDGKRQVLIGTLAEMFPGEDDFAIAAKLAKIEAELQRHELLLLRNQGELYAVQQLRERGADLSWLAEGMRWSAMITTVGLEMAVPGIAGWWLEKQTGIPYLAILGLAIGPPLGLWHLIMMTRNKRKA